MGFKKLALIAAGALVFVGVEAQASPMTEGTFVNYLIGNHDAGGPQWRRGSTIFLHFINWRQSNPAFSVTNIAWVDRWAGDGGSLERPIKGNPQLTEEEAWFVEQTTPPWRNEIPEPGTALALSGLMGLMAMRRRTA